MTPDLAVLLGCCAAVAGAGLVEKAGLGRARRRVSTRIHVNGTRGKSTVTRLIWAALRAAGVRTMGKTTGTAPLLLLPDGSEEPVLRRGRPNIREQVWALGVARRLGAEAAVLECMALRPELQWASEHRVVRATVGVVTNARLDHGEVMGATVEEVACALANTVPRDGCLVLGDEAHAGPLLDRARVVGAEVVHASEVELVSQEAGHRPAWLAEDLRTALAVTRRLGIADQVALAGMDAVPVGAGCARVDHLEGPEGPVPVLDASAANDPDSLTVLVGDLLPRCGPHDNRPALVVFNHREDRPERLRCMAAAGFGLEPPIELLTTGERPALWQRLQLARRGLETTHVPVAELREALPERLAGVRAVLLCGNSRGLDTGSLLGG